MRPDFVLLEQRGLTTLAFVAIEGGEPVYTFYNNGTADTLMQIDEFPSAVFAETRILHCVGSVSLLGGSTPQAVIATAERLKGQALISFDPNIRANMAHDEAQYRALVGQMMGLADLVKVSAADLAWLMPGQTDAQIASAILGRGVSLLVITQGRHGVTAFAPNPGGPPVQLHVPAFPITVADTVGAGDAFSSGLLAALAERNIITATALYQLPIAELEQALRFASAVAAITTTRAGSNPPTRAEVEQFLAG
ncbi:MAG: carbohydrate kinase [Chloroflexaceae bacterium]|nr:carbohydrate kinase [Chloroflexaceae bacterium]